MSFDKSMGIVAMLFGAYLALTSFGLLPLPNRPFPTFSVAWAFFAWGYCLLRIEKLKQQLEA